MLLDYNKSKMKNTLLFFLIFLVLTNTNAQSNLNLSSEPVFNKTFSFTADLKVNYSSDNAECTFIDLDGDHKIIINSQTPRYCNFKYKINSSIKTLQEFNVMPYKFKDNKLNLSYDKKTLKDGNLTLYFYANGSGEFNITYAEKDSKIHDPTIILGCGNIPDSTQAILNESINNAVGTCIIFDGNNSELNCDGFTIDGDDSGTDYGVYLNSKSNNIVRNCIITDFLIGIRLFASSSNNFIINNTCDSNKGGIYSYSSSDYNNIINNSVNNNFFYGFYLEGSDNDNLTNNNATFNDINIGLQDSQNNNINTNKACDGISGDFSSGNWYGSSGSNNSCDVPDGWNDTGTTGCSFNCSGCTSNLVNGSWMYKFNSSCLPNNTEIYYYELIQEDLNGCIDNVTFYTQNSSICDYCTENITNSSWIDGDCLINDSYNKTCIQYDLNNCNETINISFVEWFECDYCIPDLHNTSWVYISSGDCQSNNSKLDYYELTQYDNNSCIDNVTYSMSNYSDCNYTAPEEIDLTFGLAGFLTTDNITYFLFFLIILIIIYVITKLLTKNEK